MEAAHSDMRDDGLADFRLIHTFGTGIEGSSRLTFAALS